MQKSDFTGKIPYYAFLLFFRFVGSIITLGIAYPFLEIIRLKYLCKCTFIDGKQLKFVGSLQSIIFLYFKWFFFSIITLGIFSFKMSFLLYKWRCENTVFAENNGQQSKWNALGIDKFIYKWVCIILCILSLSIALPRLLCRYKKWEKNQTIINGNRLQFSGKTNDFFLQYLLYYFLCICSLGLFYFFLRGFLYRYLCQNTHLSPDNKNEYPSMIEYLVRFPFFKKIIPKKWYQIKKKETD